MGLNLRWLTKGDGGLIFKVMSLKFGIIDQRVKEEDRYVCHKKFDLETPQYRYYPMKFVKTSKTTFFTERRRWLLLDLNTFLTYK